MNTVEQLNKYLAEGWKIFPLKPDSKEPFTNNGFYEAVRISEDKVALEYWNGKTNNWGVSLGDSDLAIIDVDIRNGGSLEIHDDCFLIYSEEGYSQRVPATRLVKTGGGGYHLYYKG